jgi:UDP-N-acetylmuramoylalanine--D-glutamate ligase
VSNSRSVAVVGYGTEGKSAVRYWQEQGDTVTVCDANTDLKLPADISTQLGPDYLKSLDRYDLIVRSPGVRPRLLLEANPHLSATKITSVTNEFLAECPARIIGVTGTKGKGTTSTLIAKMLEAAGHKVWLGGNIGTAALDFLSEVKPSDWVVLELSSFQLMDARFSPHVAIMLMIAPDHLDWHPEMGEYLAAKQNIFKFQQPGDRAVFNACNLYSLQAGLGAPSDQMAYNSSTGAWVNGDEVKIGNTTICTTDEIALLGRHNWDNICAAITAVWPITQDGAAIKQVIREFTGLEHRLEMVTEIDGVTYINDSYSANPEPTIAALRAVRQPKVLIVGGFDRGTPIQALIREITHANIRQVVVIGETAPQIVAGLQAAGFKDYSLGTADLAECVELAANLAQPGDVVLFSPGAPSFDMFTNFNQRGLKFKQAVAQLRSKS